MSRSGDAVGAGASRLVTGNAAIGVGTTNEVLAETGILCVVL
jgi:hypothetical protein